ncbi:MAG TPA: carboxylesterase family protein, partial [Anaerolineales bacterium]|nr:carboxylesterase family protein [Anaerolineales bacterium]
LQELYDLYASDPQRIWTAEGDIILAMGDDYAFRVQTLDVAAAQAQVARTYVYRVSYPVNLPDQPCQNGRSPHGGELPFVFGRVNDGTGFDFIGLPRDAQDDLARNRLQGQMIRAWTNFARTGDPNGTDLPQWPRFEAETQPVFIFDADPRVEQAPFFAEYQAMSEFMQVFNVFDALK